MSAQPTSVALIEQFPFHAAIDRLGSDVGVRDRARATIGVGLMAVRFGLPETDFTIVEIEDAGQPVLAVAYAGNAGVYEGSWNKIQSPSRSDLYTITLDDEDFDARNGMTQTVYEAMVRQAVLERRRILPDSREAALQARKLELATWLTGNVAKRFFAPQARVDSQHEPRFTEAMRHFPERAIRFRPGLLLPRTESVAVT